MFSNACMIWATGAMTRGESPFRTSSVAMIFGPTRKQLVWAPGQGVTATTSWWAPGGPLQPRGPPRSRGLRGPRYATV